MYETEKKHFIEPAATSSQIVGLKIGMFSS
jgi:hypothetical protein